MKRIKYFLFVCLLCWFTISGAQDRAKVEVFIFLNTECPISQASVSAINHLVKKYTDARFYSVFTHWDTRRQVREFARRFGLTSAIKHDKKHTLVHAWMVTTTPEVVMINKQGAILYRGLMDDSFIALGRKRDSITISYLDTAIREYHMFGKVKIPSTIPVGCRIESIGK